MIYLASPYSANPASNYKLVERYVAQELAQESDVWFYSPILYYHPVAMTFALPTDAEYWWGLNRAAMDRADEVHVLQFPGWDTSVGVAREIGYAYGIGKPLFFIHPPQI
jgi:nucleoside 2-deoxyribosyltransferase